MAVFIASSDNTVDVFAQVFPAFEKFWPDCPFPVFVGFNQAQPAGKYQAIRAPVSGWRTELKHQIEQVEAERILLLLDDFLLLSPVQTPVLLALSQLARKEDLPYLRLIRRSGAWLTRLVQRIKFLGTGNPIEKLNPQMPYHSALQIAIWRRTHLLQMLSQPGSIWDFEHQSLASSAHYAILGNPPIRYSHVVEKGSYCATAAATFRRAGLTLNPGQRKVEEASRKYNSYYQQLKFGLIGYAGMRFKKSVSVLYAQFKKNRGNEL